MECCRSLVIVFLVTIFFLATCQRLCPAPPWPRDCPGIENSLRKTYHTSPIVGGVFSISSWLVDRQNKQSCSLCRETHGNALIAARFAAEQAEALILASKLFRNLTRFRDQFLGYDISDSCGNHRAEEKTQQECISQLSVLARTLATVVGPYYAANGVSLTVSEMLRIFLRLAPRSKDNQGVFSLLDVPFPTTSSAQMPFVPQVVMFQQTCELQASAALEFAIRLGWKDVTVVGSGDACGAAALRLFKERWDTVPCGFKLKVMYLQEEPIQSDVLSNSARDFLQPDYITTNEQSLFQTALIAKRHVIILSSVAFADTVLQDFISNLVNSVDQLPYKNYDFLFGDFWGDPRRIRAILDQMVYLADQSHTLFGLRNAVNGTDKFQNHMTSIRFNDSYFQNNHFLQKLWETQFSCSIDNGSCKTSSSTETFPKIRRAILRNYKAPLIMDAVYALQTYLQQTSSTRPVAFFRDVFNMLTNGNVLEVKSEWTGNRWLFGIPYGTTDSVNWMQPLEWGYEIMGLFVSRHEDNRKLIDGNLYATWKINKRSDTAGILSFVNSISKFSLDYCQTNCDSKSLYSMSSLVFITLTFLLIVCVTWTLRNGVDKAKDLIKLPGVSVLTFCTILSIGVSLWLIFEGEAIDCESRVDDLLVTVINSMSFTVLLIFVIVLLVRNRLIKMALKMFGFLMLISIQIAISAVAHVMPSENSNGKDHVDYCSEERRKPLAVISYLYGDLSFTVFVLLLLCHLWCKWGDFSNSNKCFKFVSAAFALILWIVYTLMIVLLVFIDGKSCTQMGQIFIVIAVFPSIVCLCIIAILSLSKLGSATYDDDVFSDDPHTSNAIALQAPPRPVVSLFEGFPELTTRKSRSFSLSSDLLKEMDDVIIVPQRIKIISVIGRGNFGRVYKGLLDDGSSVAVKAMLDIESNTQVNDFVREGLQMKKFKHDNVMELAGICWTKHKDGSSVQLTTPLIVLPYMELGDLKTYLRKSRPGRESTAENMSISLIQLVKFGHQIAKGMEYLSNAEVVHRDLAARNCMVNWNLEIRVADFGLSRSVAGKSYYRMGQVGRLPVRWMAPESLVDLVFNLNTDVWSYGVTLWEVMTLAQVPYPGVDNQDVLSYLKSGRRLEKPNECPQRVYEIMQQCWKTQPNARPTFCTIVTDIELYLSTIADYIKPSSPTTDSSFDPYVKWKLLPVPKEMEREEEEEEEEETDKYDDTEDMIMIKHTLTSPKSVSSRQGSQSTSSRIVSLFSAMTRRVSNGMVPRSSSDVFGKHGSDGGVEARQFSI